MRKNAPNQNAAPTGWPRGNPAVGFSSPLVPQCRKPPPATWECKRVSHRRSQMYCNNNDQRPNFDFRVKDAEKVEKKKVLANKDDDSNTIRNDLRNRSGRRNAQKIENEFSDQDVRNAGPRNGFDSAEQVEEISRKFNALNLRNNLCHRPETYTSTSRNIYSLQRSNFRELSLYPTVEDICRSKLPSLEPNKISGAYNNVEHYLNVQFRLLREDFMASVRNGVQCFQNSSNPSQSKYDKIRIYPKIQFERVKSTNSNKLGILVNFDPDSKMRNFRWKESKRFMFGSLLLFTVDNFRNFFFCTVVERDIDGLKGGKILVSLTDRAKGDSLFFRRHYLMAECEAFFDPYFLVMKLLRQFDERTFPMTKYIVQGAVDPQYPTYVSDFGVLKVSERIIAPITVDDEFWPSANELQLDQYQHRAFKAALTRDFCVIQGPPGTGKTFIGLKIVQNIWHNAKSFNFKLKLPILVVCSANHAVDQFLEGVLKFTQNVVRVGGQSRSEIMKKYNLRERARAENRFFSTKFLNVAIKTCQRGVDRVGMQMKCVENPSGILRASLLSDIVDSKYQSLIEDDSCLIKWLLPDQSNGKSYEESDFKKFWFENESKKTAPEKNQEFVEFEEDDDYVDDEEEETCDPDQKSYRLGDECCYSISLQELGRKCLTCIDNYFKIISNENKFTNKEVFYKKKNSCKNDISRYMRQFNNLKAFIDKPIYNDEYINHHKLLNEVPDKLKLDQRWLIYWQWTTKLRTVLSKQLDELEKLHSDNVQQYDECRQQQDLEVMRKADVVGMTTSGAARLNALLKSLQPTVVVVEEAGEVLETHVVASLTNKCQHVILIGDHEQLRPITAMYELSRDYNMNVSLFERLVKNGMDCPVLNVQHRMRPEISCLISPLIYPDLKNHPSVLNFESVRGVKKNVFFIDHNIFEKTATDTLSKQNEHEAAFVILLATYLIRQQYDPAKITILTTYSAQRIFLRNLQREYSLDQRVQCIVVDKYQGEENDIVLLSLVRSNADGNIGFLDTKNRVCVALSRAKKGFFIIGNMSCLTKKSALWRSIEKTLTENGAIGKQLPLYCSIHDKTTLVASAEDYQYVTSGGCDSVCNMRMDCGHICTLRCHYTSGDHPRIKCMKRCEKYCKGCKTSRRLFCWEMNEPCSNQVLKIIQTCGHTVTFKCSIEPKLENCPKCRVESFSFQKKSSQYVSCTKKYTLRNRSQDATSVRSFGGAATFPKHSYSFTPSLFLPNRRPFFSGCCLL